MRYRRGNVSIYGIVGMLVMIMFLPMVISMLRILSTYELMDETIQDEISLYQMRRILILGEDIKVKGGELKYYLDGDKKIKMNENHFYITPGTQILITQVELGNFERDSGIVYIQYSRGGKKYRRVIINE